MSRYVGDTKLPLLNKLLNKIVVNPVTDCWEWQAGTNNIGYGMIRDGSKMRTAHRVSYEEHNNVQIPIGKCVLHTCDNTKCVNPDHLWIGSLKDNTQDMIRKGRSNHFGNTRITKETCPHCNKTMVRNMLVRWHLDNCKYKP
jgi:hypothetical protein